MKNNVKRNDIEKDDIEEVEEIPVNRDSVKNIIFEIAVDMFALDEREKDSFENMELEYDLRCDNLDIVEFIMNIEDEFGLSIDENESRNLLTFKDFINFVWDRISSDEIEE